MEYWQRALQKLGPRKAFTLRLGVATARNAEDAEPNFIDYIRRRIARQLKRALGRPVAFWFTAEVDKWSLPHLHGSVGITNAEEEIARAAMKRAGGDWTGPASKQVVFAPIYDGPGWAGYASKRIRRKHEIKGNFGRGFTATRALNAEAEKLYMRHRDGVLLLRQWRLDHPHVFKRKPRS